MRPGLCVMIAAALAWGVPALAADKTASTPAPPTVQEIPDPDPSDPEHTYSYCIALSKVKPEQSIELAGKWIGLGGGEPARHCEALSLVGLQAYGEGASRLEDLAQKSKGTATLRAGMLEQASQAWMLEGEYTRAYAAETTALKIVPEATPLEVTLLTDRAATLAEGAKYAAAIVDLTAALAVDPDNGDALAFRASAHRHLDELDLALTDAEHAVKADPKNVTALLERADIYRLKDRLSDARRDWVQIVEIAPDSDAARAAKDNMEKLDFKPDGAKPAGAPAKQ